MPKNQVLAGPTVGGVMGLAAPGRAGAPSGSTGRYDDGQPGDDAGQFVRPDALPGNATDAGGPAARGRWPLPARLSTRHARVADEERSRELHGNELRNQPPAGHARTG